MKKPIYVLLFCLFAVVGLIAVFNINVITKQGINYQVRTIKLPLYLKVLDFFDRHYNYKQAVKAIILTQDSEKDRIMKILAWTYQNIRKQPESLPVIDDHVWHIIIRGYGVSDQFCDVFTTLCNYAEIEAWFDFVSLGDRHSRRPLSFVNLDNRIFIFDPWCGIYFENNNAELADIKEIKEGNYVIKSIGKIEGEIPDYTSYAKNLNEEIWQKRFERAQIQSPLKRIMFELKKRINK